MGRSEDEVGALVDAVRDHRKFKQLACYSIDTLAKTLALPNSRWREYIDLAIERDAARIVIDVVKQHPGDEDVLLRATTCLSRLAINATNAAIIVEEGGVQARRRRRRRRHRLAQPRVLLSLLHDRSRVRRIV